MEHDKMTKSDTIALQKLISHSGFRFNECLHLEKKNFDLTRKTIILEISTNMGRCRKATIRPDDVDWFAKWLDTIDDRLFPLCERTMRYKLKSIGVSNTLHLRKQIIQTMQSLNAIGSMIAMKMGYFVYLGEPNEKSILFENLQEFEQIHFGVKNGAKLS